MPEITDHQIHIPGLKMRLCAEGYQLHQQWLEALETHDLVVIYECMRAYFTHKNGTNPAKRCRECGRWEIENG